MRRVARRWVVLGVAVLLLGPGCSSGDDVASTTQASASTTSGPSTSGPPTTSAETPTATDPTSSTPGDPAVVIDPAPTSGPGATVVAPPAAEAGGWRLVVTYPVAGSSVGQVAVLCYEVTGPSGGPEIALDVTVGGGAPIRVAGSAGRGSARVDLGTTGYDPLAVYVQLIVDGERLDGAAVTIPEVLVVPAAADPECA